MKVALVAFALLCPYVVPPLLVTDEFRITLVSTQKSETCFIFGAINCVIAYPSKLFYV